MFPGSLKKKKKRKSTTFPFSHQRGMGIPFGIFLNPLGNSKINNLWGVSDQPRRLGSEGHWLGSLAERSLKNNWASRLRRDPCKIWDPKIPGEKRKINYNHCWKFGVKTSLQKFGSNVWSKVKLCSALGVQELIQKEGKLEPKSELDILMRGWDQEMAIQWNSARPFRN